MEVTLDDPDVSAVLDGYRTCEFATVGRRLLPAAGRVLAGVPESGRISLERAADRAFRS